MVLVRTHRAGVPLDQEPCALAVGGAESNVAIGLARFGHSVRWISALGSDVFGDMIESVISGEGVEVATRRHAGRPTGLMVKSPSVGNERFVTYYRAGSAASTMGEDSVSDLALSDARLLHVTGITPALSESAQRMILNVVNRAKSLAVTVSFDVNFRPALWSEIEASPVFRQLAAQSDIVFGDHAELSMLIDAEPLDERDLLESVAELGPDQVVLKRGEYGAAALVRGEYQERGALTIDVVDTVGAGDAFVAGYLSGYLDAADVSESLLRGVVCGGLACTNPGDWEGAPTRVEFEATRLGVAL
jgi:2-dehydro-3-deoxygluconokinase